MENEIVAELFTTSGCQHCEGVWPILQQVAQQMGVQAKHFKANEHTALAAQRHVRYLPTLVVVSGDRVLRTKQGKMREPGIRATIQGAMDDI